MKKFLAIVMCLAMALSMMTVVSFAAGEPTFRLTSATAKAGEEVTLSMMVENNPGITACAIAVKYPAGLTLTGKATYSSLFSGGACVVGGNAAENPYKVNWSEDFDNFYEDGEFYTLTFKVADDAVAGDYEIVVSYDQADVYNADIEDVVFTTVNGVITVEADEPVVTTPTVEATPVDAPDEDGQPVALYILQPKNATTYGIKYTGSNEAYKDAKFASLAPASDAMAAVKVIGLDNSFEAYAE